MKQVHAWATWPHFVDHLAPVWLALDPSERATFYVGGKEARQRASAWGIAATYVRRFPDYDVTRVEGRQPHVLVAGYTDLKRTGKRRAVLVEHGTGQDYRVDGAPVAPNYAGGPDRHRVDVFLCPNTEVAERNAAVYPQAVSAPVGSARVEYLRGLVHTPTPEPTVAVSFHWNCTIIPECGWAWPQYRPLIEACWRDAPWSWLGHAHPRAAAVLLPWWRRIGVPTAGTFDRVVETADVYVVDNSSTLYEFAALDRPVVVLNAPQYRRDVHHGLRFWTHADVGVQVDRPVDLFDAISDSLVNDPHAERRRQIVADVYGDTAGAAARAAAVLREALP